jgi:hypothetical protein
VEERRRRRRGLFIHLMNPTPTFNPKKYIPHSLVAKLVPPQENHTTINAS